MKHDSPFSSHAVRWLSITVLAAAVILAACAPASPTPAAVEPTVAATSTTMPTDPMPTDPPQAASTAAPVASPTTPPAAAAGQVTYQIVPGESKVTYEVGETFLNQNNRFNLAVGTTTQVTGSVIGDVNNPSAVTLGTFEIDISKFASDSSRRDGYIRSNGLESGKYPIAKFVPTKVESLPIIVHRRAGCCPQGDRRSNHQNYYQARHLGRDHPPGKWRPDRKSHHRDSDV